MKKSDARAKKIARGIELAYDSLSSHLYWSYHASSEGKIFHKKSIKQYAEIIKILTELY